MEQSNHIRAETLVDKYFGFEQTKLRTPIRIAGGVIPYRLICLLVGNLEIAVKEILADILPGGFRISDFWRMASERNGGCQQDY
jgi:hypothetical protein